MNHYLKLSLIAIVVVNTVIYAVENSNPIISHKEKATNYGSFLESYIKSRQAYPNKIYDLLCDYIDKDDPVVDVACGTALSTVALLERFPNTRGCDIDERMLSEARKIDPNLFDLADVYDLPYEDARFSLVTAFDAFHWFCDKNSVAEIARVLKADGYFYAVSTCQVYTETSFRSRVKKIVEDVIGYPLENNKSNYHPQDVLSQNGFEIIQSDDMALEKFYTPDEALARLQGSNDMWSPVLKAGKEKEVIARLEVFLKENTDSDGKICENYTLKIVLAKKCCQILKKWI